MTTSHFETSGKHTAKSLRSVTVMCDYNSSRNQCLLSQIHLITASSSHLIYFIHKLSRSFLLLVISAPSFNSLPEIVDIAAPSTLSADRRIARDWYTSKNFLAPENQRWIQVLSRWLVRDHLLNLTFQKSPESPSILYEYFILQSVVRNRTTWRRPCTIRG